jgi:flagellar biosynthesis component FlhA
MDGASKFVRGDAVAGMLILLINIVGGLPLACLQHDLSAGKPPTPTSCWPSVTRWWRRFPGC